MGRRPVPWILTLWILSSVWAGQERIPAERWSRYVTAEQAGFSSKKLEKARELFDRSGFRAAMLVRGGAVVAAWGDVERRLECDGVADVLLTALHGIHVWAGDLDPSATLAQYGIQDENPPLDAHQLQAQLVHLLVSCSGVHHPAASESLPWKLQRMRRHDHAPGQAWCYNVWDHNILLTLFELATGARFFDALNHEIAGPLEMQDYRPSDGYYRFEEGVSMHPAFPLRMSTRDLARFGLLYLRGGKWGERQVVPEEWVAQSTHAWMQTGYGDGFGFQWWISGAKLLEKYGTYSALGRGNSIDVLPGLDIVLVYRGNPERTWSDANAMRLKFLDLILKAVQGEPEPDAGLTGLSAVSRAWRAAEVDPAVLDGYAGQYPFSFGITATVRRKGGQLKLDFGQGAFDLVPLSATEFVMFDSGERVFFSPGDEDRPFRMVIQDLVEREGRWWMFVERLDEAVEWFGLNVRYFPESYRAHNSLGEAYAFNGQREAALQSLRRSLELKPEENPALGMLRVLTEKKPRASRP